MAITMAATILWSAVGTRAVIPRLPTTRFISRPGIGQVLRGVASDSWNAVQNPSFKWLAGGSLCSFVMVGTQTALALYIANFFWELSDSAKALLLMATPVGFFLGIALTRRIHERFDKRGTMIGGSIVYLSFQIAPVVLRLTEIFPTNDSPLLVPTLILCGVAAGTGGVQAVVTGSSMMADVADEHELATGRRQEGIFFGALSFAAKGASGFGSMLGGFALDLIRFPSAAVPGQVSPEIVFRLGSVYGPMLAVLAVLSVWLVSHYHLTRDDHAKISAELRERRAPPDAIP